MRLQYNVVVLILLFAAGFQCTRGSATKELGLEELTTRELFEFKLKNPNQLIGTGIAVASDIERARIRARSLALEDLGKTIRGVLIRSVQEYEKVEDREQVAVRFRQVDIEAITVPLPSRAHPLEYRAWQNTDGSFHSAMYVSLDWPTYSSYVRSIPEKKTLEEIVNIVDQLRGMKK